MNTDDRVRGVAVGAAVGDALGMPLEFRPRVPADRLVREMRPGRLPAGAFTDDTEMALALADSLLERFPLDPDNLAAHFVAWYRSGPADIGLQTSGVLSRIAAGEPWRAASEAVQAARPDSAGNGSVMRCWPVALAYHRDPSALTAAGELQSRITHSHPDCVAGCAFIDATLCHLLAGATPAEAVAAALRELALPAAVRRVVEAAPGRNREQLKNTGWVRHTLESAVWGLLTTASFEEAVVQVANLGDDADTAASVVGALAGAAYGVSGIPSRWRTAVRGEWPVGSGVVWREAELIAVADRLAAL